MICLNFGENFRERKQKEIGWMNGHKLVQCPIWLLRARIFGRQSSHSIQHLHVPYTPDLSITQKTMSQILRFWYVESM
jgi:hypothetical protein